MGVRNSLERLLMYTGFVTLVGVAAVVGLVAYLWVESKKPPAEDR
jgi:uncharacterized membrane protein